MAPSPNTTGGSRPSSRSSSPFFALTSSFDKILPKGSNRGQITRENDNAAANNNKRSPGYDGKKVANASGDNSIVSSLTKNITESIDNVVHQLTSDMDVQPFAIHHDELLTALIDEALRNSGSVVGGVTTNGGCSTVEEVQPGSTEMRTESRDALSNNDSGDSPYRMKRNISKQLGSPWKRRRGGSIDGTKKSGSVRSKLLFSSSPQTLTPTTTPYNTTTTNPADFFHPNCILRTEKVEKAKSSLGFGRMNSSRKGVNNNNENEQRTSATGREETLLKLRKKLSMLGDIESGKFGKAAEMFRSDAVAFAIRGGDDRSNASLMSKMNTDVTKVETRSILTLRMGFVSMSYGILLQWSVMKKVELVRLHKMCRNDFLKQTKTPLVASRGESISSRKSPPSSPDKRRKPDLMPVQERESHNEVEVNSADLRDSPEGNIHHGRLRPLPKFSWPPNPLHAVMPKLFSPSSRPKSFLSVSVLNVKGLHGGCDHSMTIGGIWSSIIGGNNHPTTTSNSTARRRGRMRKRKDTIRPYVRFILGEHEHCTKTTKFTNGNPTWTNRHHNSCLLPCPPEELRWFAGQEDLIVEVHDDRKSRSGDDGAQIDNRHYLGGIFGWRKGKGTDPSSSPIAVVTVPLSSVNIEDEEDESKGQHFKRRKAKDGASSSTTNITIPLRMTCCSHAPIGSISLKITIKAQSDGGELEDYSSSHPSALAKPEIQVDVSVSSVEGGTGEPKINESIELGPLTRFMDGWSLGARENEAPTASRSTSNGKRKRVRRKRLRLSKRFDLQTKTWLTLKPSDSNGGDGTPQASPSPSPTSKTDEGGWFTFLRRESTRDVSG